MTRVRIGIVSWNTAELLERCLSSIPQAAEGTEFEVVVVDNHSSDESASVARRHAHVRVIGNESNLGYARAMNQALHDEGDGAPADVLIALNPDTVSPPGSLTRLVTHLVAQPKVGLVVPRLSNEDGSGQHSVYRFPSVLTTLVVCIVPFWLQRGWVARNWWLEGRAPHDEAGDIDWAIGAVHVVRASALAGTAAYSERWFMYAEDMDICWRLNQQGWHIRLESDVVVQHAGNAAGSQAWGDTRAQRWWAATYDWYRLHHGVPAVRRWALTNVLGASFLLVRARVWRRLVGSRGGGSTTERIEELRRALPLHRSMWRAPQSTCLPSSPLEIPE